MSSRAETTGRRRRLTLALACLVTTCVLGTGDLDAEESRFIPWKAGATPALELHDVSGGMQTLAGYRGRIVLVNFWATWCEFCKDEVASMKKLQQQLAGRPFAIVMVNYGESPTKVRAYAQHLPPNVDVLLDPGQEVARAWRVRVVPSSFLVDAEGRIRYSVIGNLDWSAEESTSTVRALLP